MLLTVASGGTILLENPSNSLIALHDRYVWLVQLLLSFQIYATLMQQNVGIGSCSHVGVHVCAC